MRACARREFYHVYVRSIAETDTAIQIADRSPGFGRFWRFAGPSQVSDKSADPRGVRPMRMISPRRNGLAIAYVVVACVAILAIGSLAVDYGKVLLAKSQLQAAADAAAMAGARVVSSGVSAVQQAVVAVAADNSCDGTPVAIDPNTDIDFLTYDPVNHTSTVLSGNARSGANAVRVRAERTTARGNAIPLILARGVGMSSFNIHAQATAYQNPSNGGYIGLSLTRMYNTAHFDGYNANAGPYSAGSAMQGNLLSFSDLWLFDDSTVYGEAHWDVSGTFNHDPTATVSPGQCSAQNLSSSFPAVTLGNVATVNDNAKLTLYRTGNQLVIPNNKPDVTYPAGTYYFTKFDIGSGNHVYFTGPTLIYLDCAGDITSTLAPTSLRPIDLAVKVTPGKNWKIDSGGVFYGSFYNPTGDMHHHNGGISYGSVISDLLCFRQTSQGHQDLSLGKYAATVGVSLVK
jgi:Flp pilus assembly protein TadG